jgi:hypothetical protein
MHTQFHEINPGLSGLASISGVIATILAQNFEPCPGESGVVWPGSLASC